MNNNGNNKVECWKYIVGYEGMYKVSNMGRVHSIKSNKYLKIKKHNNGFSAIEIYKNHKKKLFFIHRLVALYFVPNLHSYRFVKHIDGDKKNNCANNLCWFTNKKEKKKKIIPDIINLEGEVWINIKDHAGKYKISNMGRVQNVVMKYIMKPEICNGYYRIALINKNNKRNHHLVHRLVAQHFISNSQNKKIVDHIDNNKLNNKFDNLRWVSQSENSLSYQRNYRKYNPILQYDMDGKFIKKWKNIKEIVETTGYYRDPLSICLHGRKKYYKKCMWIYENPIATPQEIKLEKDEVFKNIGIIDECDFSRYEVSNYGKVNSLYLDRCLKVATNGSGYYNITIKDKKTKKIKGMLIHRLVASVFVLGKSENNDIVNHIDEDKTNNHVSNLEWVSNLYNTTHSLGKPVNQIDPKSGKIINTYKSVKSVLRKFNKSIKSTIIYNVCNGNRKSAYGYKWEYVDKIDK
uniref:HNH endonuclease n=1 Tax=Mimivirus LCMiAC01 TaxID=2506608 RepID=A0A481YZD8_9VIRU|nr:MAG: HNH endonuclease [Mimivirus LCMiAC01]